MFFVLVMDVLNRLLGWLEQQGLLEPVAGLLGHRVSLYADDLVMFVRPDRQSLEAVKAVLHIFGLATGLVANLEKSAATPINCSEEELSLVQSTLNCLQVQFPCRYLGIPLSVFRLKRSDEQPLIDKVAARIPGWNGGLLNAPGRTALTKATLSAIPVHTAIAVCLSPWAIATIDKLRRAFIWSGRDEVGGGHCKVAWPVVTRPKELGGLGVSDLRRVGVTLRARWVWQDRTNGRPPRTAERQVIHLFQAATICSLGDGRSIFFWTDAWLHGQRIDSFAPLVVAAVKKRKLRALVAEALPGHVWVRHLEGAFTQRFLIQFGLLCDKLEEMQLVDGPNTFIWRLSANGQYSAASAYGAMFLGSSPVLGAKELWKTAAPARVRFFFWLCLHDRCWTGNRRFRHGLQQSDECVLCDQAPETLDHILLGCCLSRQVWFIWLSKLQLQDVDTVAEERVPHWWISSRKLVPKTLRRGFDTLVFLIGWLLWKERNARTFGSAASLPTALFEAMLSEARAWESAGCTQLGVLLARF